MKVLVSDLDGTLFNAQGQISQPNVVALHKWLEQNLLVIASGRFVTNIRQMLRQYQLRGPIIALNGALVVDQNDQVIASHELPMTAALQKTIALCEQQQLIYTIYNSQGAYTRRYPESRTSLWKIAQARSTSPDPAEVRQAQQFYNHAFYQINQPVDDVHIMETKQQQMLKLEVFSEQPALLQTIRTINQDLNVVSSSPRNVELMAANCSKGQALKQLTQELSLDLTQCYAIGDGENDLAMFQVAGQSIAMANAAEAIKKQADFVTTSNIADGVAMAIERILNA